MNMPIRSAVLKLVLVGCSVLLAQLGQASSDRTESVMDAIVELDVARASKLLSDHSGGAGMPLERARLALYLGDCDAAQAVLSSPSLRATPEGAELLALATSCAKATAGALVIKDDKAGVQVRLQDSRDKALVPFIVEVASKARAAMQRDLGVDLPRPLRIELVRDTFSLSAITGLPVEAADTTGTLAVARWGRVTMMSPRATRRGYGWEDTLAHEITHLALARATRDRAPLWLQEGIAKREETRWREQRPGDGEPSADAIAHRAMVTGRSVGIDKLGPSIAMLPTPEAASIAYAEVQSFVNYWINENGDAALRLLFADLKGIQSNTADAALKSVSGYTLTEWNLKWRAWLGEAAEPTPAKEHPRIQGESLARWVRLTDLLHERGHFGAASKALAPALDPAKGLASVHWRAARSALADQQPEQAREALGGVSDIDVLHGAWFALKGRFEEEDGALEAAKSSYDLALSVDPLFDEVACHGRMRHEQFSSNSREHEALCRAAREIRR